MRIGTIPAYIYFCKRLTVNRVAFKLDFLRNSLCFSMKRIPERIGGDKISAFFLCSYGKPARYVVIVAKLPSKYNMKEKIDEFVVLGAYLGKLSCLLLDGNNLLRLICRAINHPRSPLKHPLHLPSVEQKA